MMRWRNGIYGLLAGLGLFFLLVVNNQVRDIAWLVVDSQGFQQKNGAMPKLVEASQLNNSNNSNRSKTIITSTTNTTATIKGCPCQNNSRSDVEKAATNEVTATSALKVHRDDLPNNRPCNVFGVSDFDDYDPCIFPKTAKYDQLIRVKLKGQFGNHLFMYAAAISRGLDTCTPLQYFSKFRNAKTRLPNLPKIMVKMDDIHDEPGSNHTIQTLKVLEGYPFYQTDHWVEQFARHRSALCYYFAMPFQEQLDFPKANDLVIHLRFFGKIGDDRNLFLRWMGQTQLKVPPPVYYERIIDSGHDDFDTVWLLVEPRRRNEPLVQRLLSKYPNKVAIREGTPEEDFQFISFASQFVMSPSTFGWWAGFFGASGTSKTTTSTIHYPIMPMDVQMPWCKLVGGFQDTSSNVIFHDWYGNKSVHNDPQEARRICEAYNETKPSLESITAFYPT